MATFSLFMGSKAAMGGTPPPPPPPGVGSYIPTFRPRRGR